MAECWGRLHCPFVGGHSHSTVTAGDVETVDASRRGWSRSAAACRSGVALRQLSQASAFSMLSYFSSLRRQVLVSRSKVRQELWGRE